MKPESVQWGMERQPLRQPFGFKGSALTCLWQIAVRIRSACGEAVGLGVQSVLWSDAGVFAQLGEDRANEAMLDVTRYALGLLPGMEAADPFEILDRIFPLTYSYAILRTGRPSLSKTFVLNALVPVDLALWQLWVRETGEMSFDRIWTLPQQRQSLLANVPLIAYGTALSDAEALARKGTPLLKIKLGCDPNGDGNRQTMLQWDRRRLQAIHDAVKDIPTDHTDSGHILYYLDANGRYDSKERLCGLLEFAERQSILERILVLEEPFPEALAVEVGDLPVRVAADESVHGMEELRQRHSLGYGALTLKPIAKGLTTSLRMAAFAREHNMDCFCADLTVNPLMVSWNQCAAARLPRLRGMKVGILESNGAQNYVNWEEMKTFHPRHDAVTERNGIYRLDEDFYAGDGGIFERPEYYWRLASRQLSTGSHE